MAEVADVRHRFPATGFPVAALKGRPERVVCGNDGMAELKPSGTYRFVGKWRDHPRHGRQFNFSVFVRHVPHDPAGLMLYLRETAPHVGQAAAERLWEAYGQDAVAALRTRWREVADRGILTLSHAEEASRTLERYAGMESARIDLWTLFDGHGIPRKAIEACLSRWGLRAAERVRRDPFTLLVHGVPGCGFLRCDGLYLRLGGDPAAMKRQMLCIWHAVHSARNGDTWFPVEWAAQTLRKHLQGATPDPVRAIRFGLRARWLDRWRDGLKQLWIAEGRNARDERAVAARATRLLEWCADEQAGEQAAAAAPGTDPDNYGWDDL